MLRGGCARVIECNRSSSAHHSVHFFQPFNLVGKGSDHAQTTRDMAERQSPDRNKRPRGTPTFLTPAKGQRVPLHEVAHQGKQLQSQKPDGHAHAKNAITLRACTTSSGQHTTNVFYSQLCLSCDQIMCGVWDDMCLTWLVVDMVPGQKAC